MNKRYLKWIDKNIKTDLVNKTILITGANSGIGFEVAKYCAYLKMNIIMAVRNTDKGILANFSTHDNGVDFAAPGVEILTSTLNDKYIRVNGTSFAAPFVSAAAASVLLINQKHMLFLF